jgi:flagellin
MVGIIANIAAQNAQANLQTASDQMTASISRLSSGNAISKASDNVAGLAIGTILQTNVSTLKTAAQNAAQAQSLLGVADGALKNLGDILQRQKALATQATSGSLTDTARGFLNQEFQNLMSEINRISDATNFNGIKLLDGSLYAPSNLTTYHNNKTVATQASGTMTIATALTDGKNIFINGATIPFHNAANKSALAGDQSLTCVDITVNTTVTAQGDALYNAINIALNYNGTDSTVLTQKKQLSQLSYTHTAATASITMTANVAGTVGNGVASGTNFCAGSDMGTATDVTLNGGNAAGKAVGTSVGIGYVAAGYTPVATAIDGDLNGGTFPTAGTAYSSTARTIAQGSVGDGILQSLAVTTQANTGIDLSQVSNNPDFVGTIKGFKASHVAPNVINAEVTVGNFIYKAVNVNTSFAAGEKVTFHATSTADGLPAVGGGQFVLTFAANSISVASQDDADIIAGRLDSAFSSIVVYQKRNVSSYTGAGTLYGTPGAAATGDLTGSSFQLIGSDFTDVKVENITVTSPVLGAANAEIKIQINGHTYTSGYDSAGTISALGSSLAAGTFGLVDQTNPNNMLIFTYTSTTNLDLSTLPNAQAAQQALLKAFNVNTGATKVTFQVGTTSADSIPVQIQGTKTTDIFIDANNNPLSADSVAIGTLEDAQNVAPYIENAVNKITSIRANVGALQSRFLYANNNIVSAIQNQDSARGVFLDADIASESTNFAQGQVKLQASISVLAQANQLPQSLLKLIG